MTFQKSVNTKIIARLRHVLGHCRENEAFTRKVIVDFIHHTRNEMGLKLGLKPLFSWFSAVSGGFRGDLDPKTRNLDPA